MEASAIEALVMEALATEAPATEALAIEALVITCYGGAGQKSAGIDSGAETIVEDLLAIDDGGVIVEDSDVDEGGASTHTQREVTASGIEKLSVCELVGHE